MKKNSYHTKTPEEIFKIFGTNKNGLTKGKANSLRLKFGKNILPRKKALSPILVFLRQFRSLMIYVLIVAAIISFILERTVDVYVIAAVILVNATIGFLQEFKAEKAIKSLNKFLVPRTKVIRNNELLQISAENLVPGDIILVEEGDRIPADSRIIEMKNLRTVESALTGESTPVEKSLKILPESISVADKKNMVWLGTFVASGKAKAVVVATGANTQIGKLAKSLESIKQKKSHFQERTDVLTRYLALIAFAGAILIFLVGYFLRKFQFSEIILFSLSSLVSGIPEGMPAVLAVVLAIGAYRMARKKAIIKNRYATETLGVVNTIITDKTGTLTENTMTVRNIFLPGQKQIEVTGSGWEPEGEFFQEEKRITPLQNKHLSKFLQAILICNNSNLIKKENGHYGIIGDPTEGALTVVAEKAGLKKQVLETKEKRIDDIPFSSDLKYHASLSTLVETEGKKQAYFVGEPEKILEKSLHVLKNGRKTRLTKRDLEKINQEINSKTSKAMRVLGVSYKEMPSDSKEIKEEDFEESTFIGLVAMFDPPRPEVKDAIKKAKLSGIKVVMATGDHKNTAIAIAKEIDLVKEKNPKALTGEELSKLSEQEFKKALEEVSIFARLSPETKLKIAKTYQEQGKVLAMTGDGVNDAPALKQADVGISMNLTGTDVARESSEMVLADDNFASIINAVEEGRVVFINTRQTTFFLVATGIAEHIAILSTMLINLPLPLLPTQILWMNLVTGGVTDVALATEQNHHDVLNEKPRKRGENILNKEIIPFLSLTVILMLAITFGAFYYYLPDEPLARTAAFSVLSFTQLFNMINFRSLTRPIYQIKYLSNKFVTVAFVISTALILIATYVPFFQNIFGFEFLPVKEMATLFLISGVVLPAGEIYKFFKMKTQKHTSQNNNSL